MTTVLLVAPSHSFGYSVINNESLFLAQYTEFDTVITFDELRDGTIFSYNVLYSSLVDVRHGGTPLSFTVDTYAFSTEWGFRSQDVADGVGNVWEACTWYDG